MYFSHCFVVFEGTGHLYLFPRDGALPEVLKNKQILFSILKPCPERHFTYIQLLRDRSLALESFLSKQMKGWVKKK